MAALAILRSLRGEFSLKLRYFGLENKQFADTREREAFTAQRSYAFDLTDLDTGVAPLTASRAGGLHHFLSVQPAQERRLDTKHRGDLTDGVQRRIVVVDGQIREVIGQGSDVIAESVASMARRPSSWPWISTLRGLARSAIGIRSVNTPAS